MLNYELVFNANTKCLILINTYGLTLNINTNFKCLILMLKT